MTTRTQECYEEVSALMSIVDALTDWEYTFIMNMAEFEEAGRLFTADQRVKVREIHRRYLD